MISAFRLDPAASRRGPCDIDRVIHYVMKLPIQPVTSI